MNRQQRRAQSKGSSQRGVNKAVAWSQIKNSLCRASIEPNTDDETIRILQPVYTAIYRLKNGLFDHDDFVVINWMTAFGYELAGDISRSGDGVTQEALSPGAVILLACSDGLKTMGERYNKLGRFGATGDELQKIVDAVSFTEQVMNVSTRGLIVSAQDRASALIEKIFKLKTPLPRISQ